MQGPFKADPEAPIHIEADRLVAFGGAKQAVFTGIVKLQQGDFQLRTVALRAFYSGKSGFSTGGEWRAEQLTRAEASGLVLTISKDGQTKATADWATFYVMANTVLMGDNVSVSRGKNVPQACTASSRSRARQRRRSPPPRKYGRNVLAELHLVPKSSPSSRFHSRVPPLLPHPSPPRF